MTVKTQGPFDETIKQQTPGNKSNTLRSILPNEQIPSELTPKSYNRGQNFTNEIVVDNMMKSNQ